MTNRITADYLTDKYNSTESLLLYSEGYFILKIEIASVSSSAYTHDSSCACFNTNYWYNNLLVENMG
jgi:hypothetical protein